MPQPSDGRLKKPGQPDQLEGLLNRLRTRYAHIPFEDLKNAFDTVVSSFDEAHIRTYVPIFVDREMLRWASSWPPDDRRTDVVNNCGARHDYQGGEGCSSSRIVPARVRARTTARLESVLRPNGSARGSTT